MIIDLILARADGTPYNAHDFYTAVSGYDEVFPEIVEPITRALDCGAETDVKQKLCDYARDYNPAICDYIQSQSDLRSLQATEKRLRRHDGKAVDGLH